MLAGRAEAAPSSGSGAAVAMAVVAVGPTASDGVAASASGRLECGIGRIIARLRRGRGGEGSMWRGCGHCGRDARGRETGPRGWGERAGRRVVGVGGRACYTGAAGAL